jgi:catechol 2,3-dioxygenase-like lactoylglutathione lyase family enzyme
MILAEQPTHTLMPLVKKTVNQDDVGAYHLFYADGRVHVLETGEGGPAAELHVLEQKDLPAPRQLFWIERPCAIALISPTGSICFYPSSPVAKNISVSDGRKSLH